MEKCRWLFSFYWLGACRDYLNRAEKRVAFLLLFLGAGLLRVPPCAGAPGVFEETGSLATARGIHTATLLPNGKVLVAGGLATSTPFASAELYDLSSGSWTTTDSLGACSFMC